MPRLYSQVILQHCDNIDYIQLQQPKTKSLTRNRREGTGEVGVVESVVVGKGGGEPK